MPIDPDARIAITLRLRTAFRETHQNYARQPGGTEILPDVALAQQWLTIEASYFGIEQTLKYLIALHKGLTVEGLLVEEGIVEHPEKEPQKRTKYRLHKLGTLFSRMDKQTREAVERDYAVWQSLYDYVPMSTCAEFLGHVQGDDNKGHLDWRYCLIQGQAPPANSADAMLAVWASLIRRCEDGAEIPHQIGAHTAYEEVRLGFCECLGRACSDYERHAAETGEPIPALREELARWAPSGACMVNKMAALLPHRDRHLDVPDSEGSEPMRRTLNTCLRRLTRDANDGMRGALPVFVRRALGYSPAGESVRWNPETGRFENLPWPLQSETMDSAPQGATHVAPEDNADGRLRDIWHCARGARYKVKETRQFAANVDQPARWHLRMRVYDQPDGGERVRISVWQECDLAGTIAVEQHKPEEPLRPPMDRWLRLCERPLRGQWLAHDEELSDDQHDLGEEGSPEQQVGEQAMPEKPILSLEKTYAAVLAAARNREFIAYGDLAAASGVPWNQARLQMGRHLDSFTLLTHQRGCPLLSSIVVLKPNRKSGVLEGRQLEGLLSAAELASVPVGDPQTFVREQQERVFAWAKTAPERLEASGQA